jgi:hypothetical protein
MTSKYVLFAGLILCISIFLLVAGCTQQSESPEQVPVTTAGEIRTPSITPGLPNPATDFCVQAGGMPEIIENPDGSEYGMCTFQNGTSCEEWSLFRGEGCKPGNVTGLANPASVYCGHQGGRTEIKKNPDGSEYGMCTFPNGTSCEEWALFQGKGCLP